MSLFYIILVFYARILRLLFYEYCYFFEAKYNKCLHFNSLIRKTQEHEIIVLIINIECEKNI